MTVSGNSTDILSGIPDGLRDPLVEEYNKVCRHFRDRRWEPAELNGGKFCEIVYSILAGYTAGTFPAGPSKPANMVDACRALEKASGFPRSVRIQIPRILLALYEIRNNRNVGHVGADVDPNHMDASLVLSMAKWVMAELVRIFHSVSIEAATDMVEALIERKAPVLWEIGDVSRVLNVGLTARDKMLVILHSSTKVLTARELAKSVEYSNLSRFRATVVVEAHKGGLLHFDVKSDAVHLSPLGVRYVEENIPLEL